MGLAIKSRDLIKFLEENGYKFVRANGSSHHIYSNGKHSVPVPIHKGKDLNEKLIRLILKQTKISKSDLYKYLNR